ncbi:unnamed protein product, partial [Ectocarpus sp. 12 AP-2014]
CCVATNTAPRSTCEHTQVPSYRSHRSEPREVYMRLWLLGDIVGDIQERERRASSVDTPKTRAASSSSRHPKVCSEVAHTLARADRQVWRCATAREREPRRRRRRPRTLLRCLLSMAVTTKTGRPHLRRAAA